MKWLSFFQLTPLIGIDLGTSRTRIWCSGKGLMIDEPTMVATDPWSKKVLAVGKEAAEMEGRVQQQIQIHHPVKAGKIYDASVVKAMLQVYLQRILGWKYLFSPVFMVSVPVGSTQANRAAVVQLLYQLGAKEVYTVAQSLAAAIGAGVPIADASGTLIFHLGAGVVEVGVISLGSLVQFQNSTAAGDYLDHKMSKFIVDHYHLKIGAPTTAKLKHQLLLTEPSQQSALVVGQDVNSHSPKEIKISAEKLAVVVATVMDQYRQLCQSLLADTYPELTTDILDKGMLLSGGLAQLVGLNRWLTDQLGIPVATVENPDLVVIEGIATALEHLDEFKQSLGYQENV
ncbi:rod shape-determining protein [Patescibacteria group bacterium]|nr:rod shape-determining protein [Patescibacteria group bacterium]MBU1966749.1 rod shape-determining protein [Patescibacteria group bacterium]MBU2543540.1 rod shape-determining protein [Patescibacteria group bacterium]